MDHSDITSSSAATAMMGLRSFLSIGNRTSVTNIIVQKMYLNFMIEDAHLVFQVDCACCTSIWSEEVLLNSDLRWFYCWIFKHSSHYLNLKCRWVPVWTKNYCQNVNYICTYYVYKINLHLCILNILKYLQEQLYRILYYIFKLFDGAKIFLSICNMYRNKIKKLKIENVYKKLKRVAIFWKYHHVGIENYHMNVWWYKKKIQNLLYYKLIE